LDIELDLAMSTELAGGIPDMALLLGIELVGAWGIPLSLLLCGQSPAN
jgi:hypothetical protein